MSVELVQRVVKPLGIKEATLDHDATIQECHKQAALPHYKGGRGYPNRAPSSGRARGWRWWTSTGMGNVPAGMSNLPLIQRGFSALPGEVTTLYFRADSACYEEPVLKWLSDLKRKYGPQGNIGFAISADMSEQLQVACKAEGVEWGRLFEDRIDETLDWAEVEFTPGDWPKDAQPLRYVRCVSVRSRSSCSPRAATRGTLAVVTNREEEMSGDEVIRWHRKKAGTIELLHDVSKNELGAGVPPSGKFGANAAWFPGCVC